MNNIAIESAKSVNDLISSGSVYSPEPAVTGVGIFNDALNIISDVGQTVVGGISTSGLGEFQDLINTQIQVQKEFQAVSLVSNIEKSVHESKMAAIRNIRVS